MCDVKQEVKRREEQNIHYMQRHINGNEEMMRTTDECTD